MNVVPEGYHTVTPWLISRGRTADLIDFIVEVFDATELGRVGEAPNIGHAEVRIGDSVVMLFDQPDWTPTPGFLRLYVADDAEVLRRAVELGARVVTEPTELFWGDRVSRFADPCGNLWWVHQRVAQPTPEEMTARMTDPVFVEAMNYVQSAVFTPQA
ncbi:VOC family protein [Lentzea sp. NBRC 102530]|uniref:VOC family protein n=1 Tax=Lentzea sp. NBRC 102530 TaxID=3032201 RepID=UPI0024A14726|nr:VOC family protein [Lentzea sp. NBRC 102530]GLY53434.1 glyoxalase/bleomycin resistance protein/dioxygenase superfamily protein [Lentzea sp. NBRC 102530]